MGLFGELHVEFHEILIIPVHTADIPLGTLLPVRDLVVLDDVGDLVGYDLPSEPPVEWDGEREQDCHGLASLPHVMEALVKEPGHYSPAGVFGICGHACDATYRSYPTVDVHLDGL